MQEWRKSPGPSDASAGIAELNIRSDLEKMIRWMRVALTIAGCPTAILSNIGKPADDVLGTWLYNKVNVVES
jgi:hypothetical protein